MKLPTSFRTLPFLTAVGFQAAPFWMSVTAVLFVLRGVTGAFAPFEIKVFVNAAIAGNEGLLVSSGITLAFLYVLNFATLVPPAQTQGFVGEKANVYLALRIAEVVNGLPGIEHFERPDYLRDVELVVANRRQMANAPGQVLRLLFVAVRSGITLVLLAQVNMIFLVLPAAALLPVFAESASQRYRKRIDDEVAEDLRLSNRLFSLATSAAAAKELRIFGSGPEIAARHLALTESVGRRVRRAGLVQALLGSFGWVAFVAIFVACLALVVSNVVGGSVTVGALVMIVALIQIIQGQLSQITSSASSLQSASLAAVRFLGLERTARAERARHFELDPPEAIRQGISLEHVSFTYPGSGSTVLDDLSVELPAGKVVALVGDNGAGKTTIVKLLTKMYEPSQGSIAVDGRALSEIDTSEWRSLSSALYQDFVRFELLAGESVGVGDLPRVDDAASIERALVTSGGADVIESLAEGLRTPLGRSFAGGRELSGGQWQKLALGRARMRRTPLLLILDEPTSNLDPVAEHALFQRYAEAASEAAAGNGAITLLVSHRFSTVRMADLILVIQEGKIVESGSHAELMAKNGWYAELFRLQAQAYLPD